MQPQTLDGRVERLEERVTILGQLPARVEELAGQISQLRAEMRGEFSAVREEIRTGGEETRGTLRDELRAAAEEIMTHARTLHEDVLSRIALIGEGRPSRRKRR
jgi:predicted phage gp36 major capsid-like protein